MYTSSAEQERSFEESEGTAIFVWKFPLEARGINTARDNNRQQTALLMTLGGRCNCASLEIATTDTTWRFKVDDSSCLLWRTNERCLLRHITSVQDFVIISTCWCRIDRASVTARLHSSVTRQVSLATCMTYRIEWTSTLTTTLRSILYRVERNVR